MSRLGRTANPGKERHQAPPKPELRVDTSKRSVEQAVGDILKLLKFDQLG